ncbi:unnamed protein product [Clonostachys byssicola]|uniref:LON peptidase N-terminal domain and RING finger protein 1 n=1 Tax=Clonostachys byssicola TaxID=160290 RepID=A0A9N9UMZ3_9HYPO|nr:unnamed protein product [Clonostachys byssicola]
MARGKAEAAKVKMSTRIAVRDEWEIAGIPSLRSPSPTSEILLGGRLVAAWSMAENGQLDFDAEVVYHDVDGESDDGNFAEFELEALHQVQEVARTEMDCQICYALFFDPLTTPCGHTFCRSCLHRILDHSLYCPICRRKLAMNPLLNRIACPANERLDLIIETFWKEELHARQGILEAEEIGRHESLDVPLFVCTLSFPMVPTFLHIFEPRYRLMIRRAVEGNRMFGMVLPKRAHFSSDREFHELGTLLRIVNVQYYPDGRSLIETMGISRFRVVEHGMLDGYTIGKTDRIDDVSLEEEEALEAREVTPATSPQSESTTSEHGFPDLAAQTQAPLALEDLTLENLEDIARFPTNQLLEFALNFVARMRANSVPWLTQRMLQLYGECPDDPTIFPWWLASMLPVRESEKYKLLETSSVRERLKICCRWIKEWEQSRWDCQMVLRYNQGDVMVILTGYIGLSEIAPFYNAVPLIPPFSLNFAREDYIVSRCV